MRKTLTTFSMLGMLAVAGFGVSAADTRDSGTTDDEVQIVPARPLYPMNNFVPAASPYSPSLTVASWLSTTGFTSPTYGVSTSSGTNSASNGYGVYSYFTHTTYWSTPALAAAHATSGGGSSGNNASLLSGWTGYRTANGDPSPVASTTSTVGVAGNGQPLLQVSFSNGVTLYYASPTTPTTNAAAPGQQPGSTTTPSQPAHANPLPPNTNLGSGGFVPVGAHR